jgi:hypothetical protein
MLLAGDKRRVETNRRSGNQTVKGSTNSASPRVSRISSQTRGSTGSAGNCATRSCQSVKLSALHQPPLQQHGQLKEADDRNVYPVPLLLGAGGKSACICGSSTLPFHWRKNTSA